MATLKSAIQLYDGMSPALRSMNKTLGIVLSTFESLQNASGNAIDTTTIQTARAEYAKTEAILSNVEENVRKANVQQNSFNQSIKSGSNAAGGLGSVFKKIVATVGSYIGIKEVFNLSDELTQTTARLNMMNDGQQTTAELQQMIFESAQRSRGSYQETADAVAKMGIMAQGAFNSNEELVAFSEQLNKQFAIAGTSQEGISAAMLQLTQAMGSGVLRGEELNSVFEQAPNIIQTIADYMGVGIGEIRSLAQEGQISATVVKNALLAASDETNAKFESMPMTIGQVWQSIKNEALMAFQPILMKINEVVNSDAFQNFVASIINLIKRIAEIALEVFNVIVVVINWVCENWAILEPIILSVVAAILLWKAAQIALNIAMNASPLMIIVTVITAIIGAIIWLSNKVGGLSVLWNYAWAAIQVGFLYAKAVILSGFYYMLYGLLWAGDKLMYAWEEIKIFAYKIWNSIANFFTQLGADILSGLQTVVNGAISLVNTLIKGVNGALGWLGVNIGLIEEVTFGDNAQKRAEEKAMEREAALQDYVNEIAAEREVRQDALSILQDKAASAWSDNVGKASEVWQNAVNFEAEQKAKEQNESEAESILKEVESNTNTTAEDTGAISESLDMTEEDLEYLRDIAEREAINRFTTAQITIEQTNNNTIGSDMDIDGVMEKWNQDFTEVLETAAEGVYV